MVKLALELKVQLDHIASIRFAEPKNEFPFQFLVQCTSCREVHSTPVTVSLIDEIELEHSHGSCNFQMKCHFCSQVMSLMLDDKMKAYDAEKAGEFVKMAQLECRNMDIQKWIVADGFEAVSESGQVFSDVDLSDDFADYDEKDGVPVEITEIETRITKIK